MKKLRTRIEDISSVGKTLSDEHLRLVTGGMKKCWDDSGSVTNPGEKDPYQDWVAD
jgi:hypothetical protein